MRQIECTELEQYQTAIEERDKEIDDLRAMLFERNLAGAESDQALARTDEKDVLLKQQVEKLNTLNTKLAKLLQQMLKSKSWKVTKPLRNYRSLLGNSEQTDGDICLANFLETTKKELAQSQMLLAKLGQKNHFVTSLKAKLIKDKPVKLICFYHHTRFVAISGVERPDEKATHEGLNMQPENPGDGLGLYNPKDPNVLRHQAELAYLYGIEAFCFYCNWQEGEPHLEQALQSYLRDDSIKLKFCLYWDNEVYDVRNNSQDRMLIPRQFKDKIISFMQHFANCLNDSRYLRVGERPLLIIRNPELLPDVTEFVAVLRQLCRENSIGEIYLACLQALTTNDPTNYGFDAAIDFMPNQLQFGEFIGKADNSVLIKRTDQQLNSGHALYSAVCPLKENASRYKDSEKRLVEVSPLHYQEQLFDALDRTTDCSKNTDERLVFIDSWNESIETQLEPDQDYGYAYLEATRMALVRKAIIENRLNDLGNSSVAVVIHAYYEELFDEILGYVSAIHTVPLKLYVTVPIKLFEVMQSKLRRQRHDFYLLPVSNRGRDILPFLKIMPVVLKAGHEFLIKIHTKKSTHRADGDKWRADIFEKLLTEEAVKENLEHLSRNPGLGILGPNEHIVPLLQYIGANAKRVAQLATRLGIANDAYNHLNFVAGSMFTARTKAIIPLMNIALPETDFEAEVKQIDGTLAHALERLFSVSAFSVNLTVSSPDNKVTESYQFVNRETDKSKPQG